MARFRRFLLTVGLLLGLAVAAGLLWRHAVVEAAARYGLAANGLEDARFEVVEVGWTEITIADLALGPGLPEARGVRILYEPLDLIFGRVREVRVDGMRLRVPADWRAALAPLPALTGGGGGWVAVARLELTDAVVTVAEPEGGTVALDGALDLSGERPGAVLQIGLALGGSEGAFTLRSDALGEGGVVAVSGGGTADLAGVALPGWADPVATAGRAEFTVEGTVPIPAGNAARPAAWLGPALTLGGDLRLDGVTSAPGAGVLSADIRWALRGDEGGLRLELPRPARMGVQGLTRRTLERLRLAADGASHDLLVTLSAEVPVFTWSSVEDGGTAAFNGHLALGLGKARADAHLRARLGHDASWRMTGPVEVAFRALAAGIGLAGPEGAGRIQEAEWEAAGAIGPDGEMVLEGPLAARIGSLAVGDATAEAVTLDGVARLTASPGRWSAGLAPDAMLSAAGVAMPGQVSIDDTVVLSVDRLDLTRSDGAVALGLSATASPFSGTLSEGGGKATAFTDAGGRLTLDLALGQAVEGEIGLAGARATLPAEAVRLSDVSGSLFLGGTPDGVALNLSAQLNDTSRVARFSPWRVEIDGAPEGEVLALSGSVETLNGAVRLPLAGAADLAAMTGRATVGPGRVIFRRGGLQPAALSPGLAAFGEVAGAVGVSGEVSVDPGGAPRSRLTLDLDDIAARRGDLEAEGISGRVVLRQLAPPATAGPQELRARRFIAGVPVERPRARFTVLPRRDGALVQIHEGTGELAGGEVAVAEARWDVAAESNALDIHVRGVALDRLLREWQIEGISGTGRLSGVIPVRIGPAGPAVGDGRLEAVGPGVVRVDWGAARETLVNSGEQVALTVRALEDFHYEALTIGVEQPPDGTLTLAIGLEGASPEVLDGYPFRFNITLSGKLDSLLAAVREGRRIGAGLLSGGLSP